MKTKFHPQRATEPRLRLRITAAAESILRSGHPWLFADSIREQNRPGLLGELAVVYDRKDQFLAVGLFDPDSPIRVRILHTGKPQAIGPEWWRARFDQALALRDGLFDDRTNGYRCINGESDGWPGLVLDRYDSTLVMKLYTAAWLPQLPEILRVLKPEADAPAPTSQTATERSSFLPLLGERAGVRASVSQHSAIKNVSVQRLVLRLSRNIQTVAAKQFNLSDGQILSGSPLPEPVVFLESGLRFEADVLRGQKTGFFLDQRENRRHAETLARGGAVLNAFSFSGGFSLYAARGGARSVTDLDISAHALDAAKCNFRLNQSDPAVARCPHETIQADTFEWLDANKKRRFDLVILDPPSLAKRESERAGAIRAYHQLATLGINVLNQNGILLAASCSAHVTAEEFFAAVRDAAANTARKFTELQTTRHPPDHSAKFKEAEYLKAIYLRLS